MKDKKKLFTIIGSAIALLIVVIAGYLFFSDENKLSRDEKKWVASNLNTVQNINIINNVNVFGDNGSGVFYDFIRDFQTEYRIEVNPVTFLQGEKPTGISFNAGIKAKKGSTIFYEDHYVIVGKENLVHSNLDGFSGKKAGILDDEKDEISPYVKSMDITTYENIDKLYEAFKDNNVDFIIVPIIRDIDKILSNNYVVSYHLSDVKYYFFFDGEKNDHLSSIIKKYFNNWKKKYFNEVFYDNEFNTFVDALKISDTDIDKLRSKTYNYGLVNQNPYEVITGGNFGGIVAVYLKEFSDFADIEFNFEKYKNSEKFKDAIKSGKMDLYYDYYNFDDAFEKTSSYYAIKVDIIAKNSNKNIINSLDSLRGKDVYVQKGSKIADFLVKNSSANIIYYGSQKDLERLRGKDLLIALDHTVFNYYHKNKFKKYESRYTFDINESYSFKVRNQKTFKTLLGAFISTLDPEVIKYRGIENHASTVAHGEILAKIAKYLLIIVTLAALFMTFIYKKTRRIIVAKKIRNDEKMKYIDLLTSLKNRNYLSENMEVWNNNKVYPQTLIVLDLNNIAYLNDTKGYEAGDRQITALANILIKTQLDNSDVMRTNGNEFLIYLVGYQQKHIVNYIHKLTKELKKLPYEYGAAIGYSMITDDIKTIEDAINEAIEDMKKQKQKSKEVKN